jgi:large subunit ribosomal protein L15
VNVADLEQAFAAGDDVNPETLRAKRLARGQFELLKVLGDGQLTKSLKVSAHRFSRSALEKIQQAGGQAIVLPGKAPVARKKRDE